MTKVFQTFSHIDYITSSVRCLRLYIISFLFLHQFLYLAPVDAVLMRIFNHLLAPTVFCTHLYLVPFLLGIRCQLMLLMHLLYLHLKHCIHALKLCKQGTSLYQHMLLLYPLLLCINSLQKKKKTVPSWRRGFLS